jgi:hypothetical protein
MGRPNTHEQPNIDFFIGDPYPLSANHQSRHPEIEGRVNPSNATRPHDFSDLPLAIRLGPSAETPNVVAVQLESTISIGLFIPDEETV